MSLQGGKILQLVLKKKPMDLEIYIEIAPTQTESFYSQEI